MTLWVKTFNFKEGENYACAQKRAYHTRRKPASTSESSVPNLPAPEEFHRYLRAQIRDATRVVMEEIMREELERFVGAAWGECVRRIGSYEIPA